MPGSWEQKQPEVLVVILTREIVTSRWAQSYRKLILPNGPDPIFLSGMPFDHARNVGCQRALEHNFKWLFFIDDDVVVPPDAYYKLSSHGHDIISGLYFRRAAPIMPVMQRDTPTGPQYITDVVAPGVVQADLVGAGCLLISSKALKTIPQPWFEWRVDRNDLPPLERTSEDFTFCRNARKSGFNIYVDLGVQCLHIGHGASSFGCNYGPISTQ